MPRFVLKKAILKENDVLEVKSSFWILSITPKSFYADGVEQNVYEVMYLDLE